MTATQPFQSLRSRPITFVFEIPTHKLAEFWEGLEGGKVYASKCANCGNISFPPVADCSLCYHSGVRWIELENEGEIETFTHVKIRPASFVSNDSYTVAVAKMKEGMKILAWVADAQPEDVEVGARVKLVARNSDHGPSYAFILMTEPG